MFFANSQLLFGLLVECFSAALFQLNPQHLNQCNNRNHQLQYQISISVPAPSPEFKCLLYFTKLKRVYFSSRCLTNKFTTMFQALLFQERDARRSLEAHKKSTDTPPAVKTPRSPKIGQRVSPQVTIAKHPTQGNLVGGKGLFLNLHISNQ